MLENLVYEIVGRGPKSGYWQELKKLCVLVETCCEKMAQNFPADWLFSISDNMRSEAWNWREKERNT